MTGKQRYQRAASDRAERKEDRVLVLSGTLGVTTNGENQVEVPGRPGFVWVQLRNQLSELIQAYNESVSPVFSLPVLVEWDKDAPIRYKVRGRDIGRYTVWVTTNAAGDTVSNTSPYLPAHGASHSFNKLTGVGGGDVVWVYGDQFIPWLVTPSGSSGALSVSIQPSAYYYDQQFRWAGGTGITGFDELYPTGSSNARMVLVYLDPDTGNPYLATGTLTEFANTITGTQQIMPYMPSLIEETDIPLAGVRIITGTSRILWQNLYDLRDYFAHSSTSGSSGGGGAPDDAQYVTMALNGTLTDERVLTAGSDITLTDGGAGGNATVGVTTGSFSRPGHTHEAGAGGYPAIYDDSVFKTTGVSISFDEDIEAVATGTTAYVGVPTGTFSRPGHTHTETNTLLFYEDDVFVATGTAIDFGTNVNVAVTGSVIYISTVDTTGGGGGDLLIYDDDVFRVTGTALDFGDNLSVAVTGSVAYVAGVGVTGSAGPPGDNTLLVYDDSVFQATGTAISFDNNLDVSVTGSVVFVDGQAGGAGNSTYTSSFVDRPSGTANDGDLFFPNNGISIYRITGSYSYQAFGPLYPFTMPNNDDFSWANQGSGTVSVVNGGIVLTCPAIAGNNARVRYKTAPSPPYTVTVALNLLSVAGNYPSAGVGWRQSSDGKLAVIYFSWNTTFIYSGKYNSPTSFNSSYTNVNPTYILSNPIFFRLEDNNTNRIVSFSPDGIIFYQVHSVGRTDFLTGDQLCFYGDAAATIPVYVNVLSWKEE